MTIERAVTQTGKDPDGDITSLCNPGQSWSPRKKDDAIRDIESGEYAYYVPMAGGAKTPIRVVHGPTGKYLRTDGDSTDRNNLDDLPDCDSNKPDTPAGPKMRPNPGHGPSHPPADRKVG